MTGIKVLIVDDEPQILDLFEIFLKDDFDVITAPSGDEALEEISESIDVILLDRRMPRTSGEELLREIRNQGYSVPIGMVTGIEPPDDISDMPFDDYIVKPVNESTLRATVDRLALRGSFDTDSREIFQLASKKVAIKNRMDSDSTGDEFQRLSERIEQLQSNVHETVLTFIENHGDAAYLLQ